MPLDERYAADAEAILSHRYDLGADYWTTPDRRLSKGAPFTALECALYLLELGMEADESPLKEVAGLLFSVWQTDGRFRLYPKGAVYPCQTAAAVRVLCQMGYAADSRVRATLSHLLSIQHTDGGWRCQKFFFGHGPETEFSNPYPTLVALDAFRFAEAPLNEAALDRAVDFLLAHWVSRKPLGPCHYGIGTLFMQVEYPFRNYNLFEYVYVLSFYRRAIQDPRFLQALAVLESKLFNGQVVVERVVPKLAGFSFCMKGKPSAPATKRYQEIRRNLTKAGF